MSQTDYGLYSNYYSFVSILVPFVGMNLYYGLANAYMDYKSDIYKLRSSVLSLSLVGLLLTSIAMLFIKMMVCLSLPYLCVFLCVAHAYGFFLVNYYIQSMNMENRFIAKGMMLAIPNILQSLMAAIAVMVCNTYISRAVGSSIGVLSCGVVAAILILRKAKPTINIEYWKYVLHISLPAIIGSVSAMIMQQCDKVMITSFIGPEETAVYALIYNIGYILYAVQQAANGVWLVWLYNTLNKGKRNNIPEVQKWYMFVMLVLATGLYMVAPEIIKILSPKEYWHFEYVAPFIIGSYLMVMYAIHMSVSQYEKKTGVNSVIVSGAALINIMLNYILIPRFSGIGAAYTSVVSYTFIFIVSGVYLKTQGDYYFKIKTFAIDFAVILLMSVLFEVFNSVVIVRYAIFLALLIIEGLYMLRNKDRLLFLLNKE